MATAPKPNELGYFSLQSESDTVDHLTHILSGTKNLVTNPGLVQALQTGNASTAQSQAIDQFMTGLNAERAVSLASQGRGTMAGGTKIALTPEEQSALDVMGVPYQSVLYTRTDAVNDYAKHVEQTNGVTIQRDANGNVVVDDKGQLQLVEHKQHHGWSIGRVLHDVTHNPVTDIGGDALNVVNKGWQIVESALTDQQKNAHAPGGFDVTNAVSRSDEMHSNGYDPDNPFSVIAYDASGLAHVDTSGVSNWWDTKNSGTFGWDGGEAVDQAQAFAKDPSVWRQSILNDPKFKGDDQAAAAQLATISNSPQFQELVRRYGSTKATIGNTLANQLGIDPVKHPTLYNYSSIALDTAAAFALDPTVIGLGQVTSAKREQLALTGLADQTRIAKVLDRTESAGFFAKRAQNALDRMVGYGNQLRSAYKANDLKTAAQISAKASAENPALATLLPDFVGANQIRVFTPSTAREFAVGEYGPGGIDQAVADIRAAREGATWDEARRTVEDSIQKRADELVHHPVYRATAERKDLGFTYESGDPLDTYDKAVDYLVSRNGLLRLTAGRGAVESSLMPGAVSAFGLRRLRGVVASFQVGRDLGRGEKITDRLTALKNADPEKFRKLLTGNDLAKLLPEAHNAYSIHTGEAIASAEDTATTSAGLASQERALSGAEKGLAAQNLRRYGSPLAPESAVGRLLAGASPTAIAERSRLAARRFANFLPRDTNIDLLSANGMDIIDRMAKTYLTKGDAALLRAQYTLGDAGTRTSVIQGLIDQLGHSAGLTRTEEGKKLLEAAKTPEQAYVHNGADLTINGQPFGMHLGQMRTTFRIPSFGEMQRQASHIGLISNTLGRFLGNKYADTFGALWRLGALAQPRTAFRAAIESWINAAVKGDAFQSARVKAYIREHEIAQSGNVFGRSRLTTALAGIGPAAKVGQFYRHILLRGFGEEDAAIALKELPEILPTMAAEYSIEHIRSEIDPLGANDAAAIARDGLAPALLQFDLAKDVHWGKGGKVREGFRMQPTDGLEGADRYVNALAVRVNQSPDVARAIVRHLSDKENPEGLAEVVRALESPEVKNLTDLSAFGKYFWKDGERDGTIAHTPEEIELGKRQWAQAMSDDFEYLMTGRNGQFQKSVADHIEEHGTAPDISWVMDNLKEDHRPTAALAPVYVAKPVNGMLGFAQGIASFEGKLYNYMVERLIQRTTTTPMFGAAYIEEKKALSGFQAELADQLGDEAANRMVMDVACNRAWERIALTVDDPQLKSQMDIVGRNFFGFSRATTTMIRRWGTTFWNNPSAARRMMLLWEGATHSGLVYTDVNGQKMFAFPGTGVMMQAMSELGSRVPFFGDMAMYPVSDLTGKATQIIPGSSNPFQFSLSPVITVPMQKISQLFPDSAQTWDEVNNLLNGPYKSQGPAGTLEPQLVRGFMQALSDDDRSSLMNSAMMGAIANLSASGQLPPQDATADERDAFLAKIKDQTKSNLFERALFSPFLFASPSNVEIGHQAADYAFSVSGLKSLDEEYKQIIKDVGGDLARAKTIFLTLHPEGTAYTVAKSSAAISKAFLPATQQSLDWMRDNQGFLKKYSSVAAYFMPQDDGPYDQAAYQAQLEYGLRIRKTSTEFYNDVRTAGADNQYFSMQQQYQNDRNAAMAEGNQSLANTLDDKWSTWKKAFGDLNPLWAQERADAEGNRLDAQDKLKSLTNMVNSNDVPSTISKNVVGTMIQAYNEYENFLSTHPGKDNFTQAMQAQAASRFISWMSQVVKSHPEVTGIYNGIFRQLDSNLDTVAVIQGGSQQ